MVKKYIDANDIMKAAESQELNDREKEYRKLMQEVPNFNHENYCADKRVYENRGFIILKVKSKGKIGYIIHNTNKPFEKGHSHLKSFEMAKVIINNVICEKKPKTSNIYLLESHIRLSNSGKYINYINGLIEIKKRKKPEYINRTSDTRR